MNKRSIATDKQAIQPTVLEIIETLDSTTRQRSRLALVPAVRIQRKSIHLRSDEFTIVPQKESGAQSR